MKKGGVACPGVFNAATARLIEEAGFQSGYISGAGLHAQHALSDTGLLSRRDVAEACARITQAVNIPLLLDGDTGFGGVGAVPKTIRLFEAAGAAGVQLEDQRFPKRCGHLPGKELVSAAEMAAKIRAAAGARRDKNFVIVARTDARGVTGFEDAVLRARSYREAGADVIFPEALATADEFRRFAREAPGPLLANMTEFGKTALIPLSEFKRLGYAAVLFPMTLFRLMMGQAREAAKILRKTGTQKSLLGRMQNRSDFYKMIHYAPRKS